MSHYEKSTALTEYWPEDSPHKGLIYAGPDTNRESH